MGSKTRLDRAPRRNRAARVGQPGPQPDLRRPVNDKPLIKPDYNESSTHFSRQSWSASEVVVAEEQRLQLIARLDSPLGEAALQSFEAQSSMPLKVRDFLTGSFLDSLGRSEAYYWAPEICHLIAQTAPSIPEFTLRDEDMPSINGFCWFVEPLPLPRFSWGELTLMAMSWGKLWPRWADLEEASEFQSEFQFCFYGLVSGMVLPVGFGSWRAGSSFEQMYHRVMDVRGELNIKGEGGSNYLRRVMQYIAAIFTFLNQKLLTVTNQDMPRAARRRSARLEGSRSYVKVVRLRKHESSSSQSDDGTSQEWSCRWLVRGHWRQQWYSATQEHRPIFITPYVKGPEDKPLREPSKTLFAVVR